MEASYVSNELVNDIFEFYSRYSGWTYNDYEKEQAIDAIRKHILYKTCLVIYDDEGRICAVCRWNIDNAGIAHILDLVIRPDFRNKLTIKRILLKGLEMYPYTRFIKWERRRKYPLKPVSFYSINKLLGGKNG